MYVIINLITLVTKIIKKNINLITLSSIVKNSDIILFL